MNYSELSIIELDGLIDKLRAIRNQKFNEQFVEIEIHPGHYQVENIMRETGFHSYHKPCVRETMGRGTTYIVIPKDKYSEELEKELIEKYDDKW
jgi:hypothetical protein